MMAHSRMPDCSKFCCITAKIPSLPTPKRTAFPQRHRLVSRNFPRRRSINIFSPPLLKCRECCIGDRSWRGGGAGGAITRRSKHERRDTATDEGWEEGPSSGMVDDGEKGEEGKMAIVT